MVTISDLTENEQIEYWHRLEAYARAGRKNLIQKQRLRSHMEASGVSRQAQDEVLAKEEARLEAERGTEPTPEDVRAERDQARE